LVRTAPSRARARTRHPARWREAARAGPTPAPSSRTGAINAAAPIGANPKTGLRSREAAEVRVDGDIHLLDLVRVRGRQPRHLELRGVAETLQLGEELVCAHDASHPGGAQARGAVHGEILSMIQLGLAGMLSPCRDVGLVVKYRK